MSDLLDEMNAAFEAVHDDEDSGPVVMESNAEMPPGVVGMKDYFSKVMLVITRRIYRWYAGATMTTDSEELLRLTSEKMVKPVTMAMLEAFSAGVMVSHRSNDLVRKCWAHDAVDHVFHDKEFMDAAKTMASGFSEDPEVWEHFTQYVAGAAEFMAHLTGFAHHELPNKVWDVWMIAGNSTATAAYLAGNRMGTSWYERDVLDGILIATEETSDGPETED